MTTKSKIKVLVTDPLGKAGMAVLKRDKAVEVEEKVGLPQDELKKVIPDYEAIIIRSGSKITKEIIDAGKKLRVIGRAGVGVDNVDLDAATKRGIIVMNTPEGNTISTAEHTFSMIMALARNIPQAHGSMQAGEWKRQKFLGTELNGKVLGIVGFGRIGREVAKRALAFGMQVVVFDPFISQQTVSGLNAEVKKFDDVIKVADFITVHTPLTPETKYLFNSKSFAQCKKGVRIVNCARGGIIEEKALMDALQSGQVAGAALDVFEKEPPENNPLTKMPQVICTPHLGAATQEAQENVAVEVAYEVLDALHERAIRNAVNLPNLDPESYKVLRPWITLAEKIGMMFTQLFPGSLKTVNVRYGGEVTRYSLTPLTVAAIKGLLAPICGETVNFVNAPAMARERGVVVNESKSTQTEDFSNYIEMEVNDESQSGAKESNRIMGTLFGNKALRVVRINEFLTDIEPKGYVLMIRNEDQPGVVGTVGSILGKNKINIAEMSLARVEKGKKVFAMTTINTDSEISSKVLDEIKKFPPIMDARVVKL